MFETYRKLYFNCPKISGVKFQLLSRTEKVLNYLCVRTVHFVEFYYICPTNAQYTSISTVCFLKHRYMFRCLYIVLRQSLIMYTKVTKLIEGKIDAGDCYKESVD